MGWLENVLVKDREIENERFEVTGKESLYFLGPNLTLRQCTVVLKVPAKRLHILGARFIDCTFEVKQELKHHQEWICASLEGCRFKGRLTGCDFGHWPEYLGEPAYQLGAIKNCDFSEARLDACRIMGADPATFRFPKWPCFTLLNPLERARELNGVDWPGGFRPVLVEGEYRDPPRMTAVTFYAPTLARRWETTEEELLAVIERLDGIVY